MYYLSFELITLEDKENSLLNRREIKTVIKNSAGKIKRTDAAELLSNRLKIGQDKIIPISMTSKTGLPDTFGYFFIYKNKDDAKRQLPRYRLLRNLTKDERKKILDDEKSAKLKAKQAAAAEKGGKKR